MRRWYVVDTNVLIAASTADPSDPKDIDATPSDPALRQKVWEWLDCFQQTADTRLILDMAFYPRHWHRLSMISPTERWSRRRWPRTIASAKGVWPLPATRIGTTGRTICVVTP